MRLSAAGNSPTERRRREEQGPYWLVLMNKDGFTRLLKDSRAVTIAQHTYLFGNTRCFVGYAACEPRSSHQTSPPSPIHSLFLASQEGSGLCGLRSWRVDTHASGAFRGQAGWATPRDSALQARPRPGSAAWASGAGRAE